MRLHQKIQLTIHFVIVTFLQLVKVLFQPKEMNNDFLDTVKLSLQNPNADLMISGGWEYMQILDRNIYLALIHKATPEEALQKTANEWNLLTDQYGREKQAQEYKEWLNLLEEVKNHEMEK